MEEDPNEQLGKLIYSGHFIEDEVDKRINNGLCPRCMCTLKPMDVHGHLQCIFCNCVIKDCCDGSA